MPQAAPSRTFHIQQVGRTEDGLSVVRLAFDLGSPSDGGADGAPAPALPTRLHVVPAGPKVRARDGRSFSVSDPAKVIANSELPLLIDWEHRSEYGQSKAAGWIHGLEFVDDGSPSAGIWGTVENWTTDGAKDVADKTYRYLSPVLVIDGESLEVFAILSVALTNTPALRLEALDAFRESMSRRGFSIHASDSTVVREEHDTMPLKKALCAVLGLAETATDEEIVNATKARKPASADGGEQVSMQAYSVVVEERNSFKTRFEAAEAKLASLEKAAFQKRVVDELDRHIQEGHVTPAEREHELARIENEDDLQRALCAWQKRPKLAQGTAPGTWESADEASRRQTEATPFSADQKKALEKVGLSVEAFEAARKRVHKED